MNRVVLGILLIVFGVLGLSAYLFGSVLALAVYWPILLVLYGVILLEGERTAYAVGMMVVGIVLLADNLLPLASLGRVSDFWPLLLIILGLFMILGVAHATQERAKVHVVSSPDGRTSVTVEAHGKTVRVVEDREGVNTEAVPAGDESSAPAPGAATEQAGPTAQASGETRFDENETAADAEPVVSEPAERAEEMPITATYENGRGHFSMDLPEAVESIRYQLHLSAGRMRVAGATDKLIEVITNKGACEPRFELQLSEIDRKKVAHLRVLPEHTSSHLPVFAGSVWEVRLNRELPLALNLEANAAKCELGLTELAVREMHLENNAAHTEIRLGERVSEVKMRLENNAAKLELKAPARFAFDAQVSGHLGHHNLTSFPIRREGEHYISQDYESSEFKLNLRADNNAASFKLRLI